MGRGGKKRRQERREEEGEDGERGDQMMGGECVCVLLNVSTNQPYSYLLCKQVEDDIVVEASVKVSQIVLCGREREE